MAYRSPYASAYRIVKVFPEPYGRRIHRTKTGVIIGYEAFSKTVETFGEAYDYIEKVCPEWQGKNAQGAEFIWTVYEQFGGVEIPAMEE